mgnify:CR=1 FL=1
MWTENKSGHMGKKSLAACDSSEEDKLGISSSSESEEDDDWPSWKLMIKHVEGNPELFKKTQPQLELNKIEQQYDLRHADSCGAALCIDHSDSDEDDPRQVRSYPTSPRFTKEFDGINFAHFGNTFDNCYAESQAPRQKGDGKEYSEMGT